MAALWLLVYLTPYEQKYVGIYIRSVSDVCNVTCHLLNVPTRPQLAKAWKDKPIVYVYKITKSRWKAAFAYLSTAIVPANNPVYVLHCATVHTCEYANCLTCTCDPVII